MGLLADQEAPAKFHKQFADLIDAEIGSGEGEHFKAVIAGAFSAVVEKFWQNSPRRWDKDDAESAFIGQAIAYFLQVTNLPRKCDTKN